MRNIMILIPSYRRPNGLRRLLDSLELIDTSDRIEVVVGDNDVTGQDGVRVVREAAASGYRFPIRAILVETPGLSDNRNALLGEFMGSPECDWVIMIDDDQVVTPGWLGALIAMQERTGAECVGPAVYPDFEGEPAPWVRRARIFQRDVTTNGPIPLLRAIHATLISRGAVASLNGHWFDLRFRKTSGEDVDFAIRMRRAGMRFARAADAKVFEIYPQSRATLSWALQRAYRGGNSNVAVARLHTPAGWFHLREIAKGSARIGVGAARLIACFWSPHLRSDAMCEIARGAGKLAGLLGHRYEEYARTHGG
jgi:succinoglycan biosynthesis protein ExoM